MASSDQLNPEIMPSTPDGLGLMDMLSQAQANASTFSDAMKSFAEVNPFASPGGNAGA